MNRTLPTLAALAALAALGLPSLTRAQDAAPRRLPAPIQDEPATQGQETLILAGGCFWGVQGVFQHVHGVSAAIAGYDGGTASTAQYETVSTGTTGHAESVRLTYDPAKITLGRLLQIYVSVVTDPTTENRQGNDIGSQYRSEIFTTSPAQASIARAYLAQLTAAHAFADPIVTIIGQDRGFYPAERYHQNYLTLNPTDPYIASQDMPKLAALKQFFPNRYRPQPVLVRGAGA